MKRKKMVFRCMTSPASRCFRLQAVGALLGVASVCVPPSIAQADVYETTCHAVPEKATRTNPNKAELIYKFTIDTRSRVAFITIFDPVGPSLPSKLRKSRVDPLRVIVMVPLKGKTVDFGLHNDRNGFDYDVTMVDHDYKGKPALDDGGRIETSVTRDASGVKTHDECGIGE